MLPLLFPSRDSLVALPPFPKTQQTQQPLFSPQPLAKTEPFSSSSPTVGSRPS
jgi:hypothetical protein